MANRSKYGNLNNKNDFDVDGIIVDLLNIGFANQPVANLINAERVIKLLDLAKEVFLKQGSMLELEPPLKICGDVHGQFPDVLRLFDRGGFPPLVNYLFLGDYVDRGSQSIETVVLFLAYKVKFPKNFFMLRGNHECMAINSVYGFYSECVEKYTQKIGNIVYMAFQNCFSFMPFTALVGGKILCMHGGISQKMESIAQLRTLKRPNTDIAQDQMEIDILWSDPDSTINGFCDSTRGVGHVFGEDALQDVMERLGIDLVVRAHQVVQDGYEFFCKKRLVTVFSAPHYCGEFDNSAAMMNVDKNLICSFQVMKPVKCKEITKELKSEK